jgi:chorismate--pyruvate lyase
MRRWHHAALGAGPQHDWLTRTGSLTRALQARCADFHVRRVRQTLGRPFPDEFEPLGLASGQRALIREVLLYCAASPVVFAHTVIPEIGLSGPWHGLANLGNRPLGAALFADPRIERFPLSFRRINRLHPLHRSARRHVAALPDRLWARRSLFSLRHRVIMVTEVFLPGVLKL